MEAAFFDLDKTIIAKSSMLAMGRPLYREGLLSRRMILKSIYGQLVYLLVGADEEKMEKLRETMLALTKGWDQNHIREIVLDALDDVVVPIIYAEARELIAEHRAAGRTVVIISSSPVEVVEPMARYLGADEAIGTRARLDDEGKYSGELEFYAYGEHKAEAIRDFATRRNIDLDGSYAYSDSITDVPMLECVGHPVAVNPDRELARVARERDWPIRSFETPVSMRHRVPVPSKGPSLVVAGVVVAGAVGAYAYYRYRRKRARLHAVGIPAGGLSETLARANVVLHSSADALRAANRVRHALVDESER